MPAVPFKAERKWDQDRLLGFRYRHLEERDSLVVGDRLHTLT